MAMIAKISVKVGIKQVFSHGKLYKRFYVVVPKPIYEIFEAKEVICEIKVGAFVKYTLKLPVTPYYNKKENTNIYYVFFPSKAFDGIKYNVNVRELQKDLYKGKEIEMEIGEL